MAHMIEVIMGGESFQTLTLETIETNMELEDKLFQMPVAKPDIN